MVQLNGADTYEHLCNVKLTSEAVECGTIYSPYSGELCKEYKEE